MDRRSSRGMGAGASWRGLSRWLLAFVLVLVAAHGQVVTETFRNSTASGWTLGTDSGSYTPTLTASNGTDTSGNGWLRLTTNANAEATYAVYNQSFAASGATVYAKFTYTSWGGTGADGLTFFLYDPTVMGSAFTPGAYGGSLGYAPKDATQGADTTHGGMAGGYLAVGLDEFGNFSNPTEGRTGGPGQTPDSVAVRGAYDPNSYTTINGVSGYYGGYNYVGGTSTLTPGIDITNTTTRPDQSGANFRQVIVSLTPTNQLSVYLQQGATSSPTLVLSLDLSTYTRPNQLAFGFSAGTGGANNYHEIRDLNISTSVANYWTGLGGNTSWNTTTNWNSLPGSYADVRFDNSIATSSQTVDLGTYSPLIRSLTIDSPYSYTINSSGGNLQFNSNGTGGSQLLVSNVNGNATSHTINAGITLANALEVQNGSTGQLNLGGVMATNGNTVTFSGAGTTAVTGGITGTGSIIKNDTGNLALNAQSTYSGGTTLNSGTITVGNNGALGTGSVTLNGGTLASSANNNVGNILTLQGSTTVQNITTSGTLTNTGGNNTLNMIGATQSGTVNLSESSSTSRTLNVNVDSGYSATISGVIQNSASAGSAVGSLNMTGQGTLTLSGANTYTGTTTVNAGTLQLGSSDRLADSSSLNIAGGTFNLNGYSEKVGNLSWSNNGTLDFGSATGANTFVFGSISSQSGVLVVNNFEYGTDKLGSTAATQNVTSIYISGYGNATEATSTTNLGAYGNVYLINPTLPTGSTWISNSSTSWGTNSNWSPSGAPNSTSALAIFDGTGTSATATLGSNTTLNGLRFDAGAIAYTINGTRTLTMSSTNTNIAAYIQQKSAQTQTLSFTTLSLARNTVFDVTGSGDLVVNSTITGSTNLIKDGTGAGKLILTGSNTNFTGGVYINNGVLEVRNSNAFGGTSGVNISTGATLNINGGRTLNDTITVGGTGYSGQGAIHSVAGNNTLSGSISLNGSPTSFSADSGTSLSVSGNVALGGNNLYLEGAGNHSISGTISGSGSVTANGTGTVTLSGSNTYTGGATAASGTLAITNSGALGSGVVTVNNNVTNGAALSLNAGGMTVNNTISLAGTGVGGNGAIRNTTGTNTIAGPINLTSDSRIQADSGSTLNLNGTVTLGYNQLALGGAGSINFGGDLVSTTGSVIDKTDSGFLTFNTPFNFNGTITLDAGTLNLSSAASGSTITNLVLNGGTLLLSGGTYNITNLTINGTSTIDFGNGTAVTLNATNLTLGASLGVNGLSITNWVNTVDTFYASTVNGHTATDINRGDVPLNDIAFTPGYTGSSTAWLTWDGTNKFITPVPEPSTYGMIFGAGSLLFWWIVRRRRAA